MSTDPATAGTTPTPVGDPGQPNWAGYSRFAVIAAIAGLSLFAAVAVTTAGSNAGTRRVAAAYLTGFTFWLSLPVGAMALLLIAHLVKSSWGLLLRRYLEAATRTLPLIIVLWAVLAGLASSSASPYWWSHPEDILPPATESQESVLSSTTDKKEQAIKLNKIMIRRAAEHEQEARAKGNFSFLSKPAFIGVGALVLLIWVAMTFFLNKWGREVATAPNRAAAEAGLTKLNKLGGPGLIIYAITLTAAATQWVMSIEPSWSSTMFPVIFAVNQFLTAFALCLALFLLISTRSPFKEVMRPKFQLDMGTLLLAFTLFWSYTSFSQFMLVWIGNLPEEIPFFLRRSAGGWWYVSAALCVFHFALPFLLLLFRNIKENPTRLRYVAVYLLVICAIDVTWWVAPTYVDVDSFPACLMDMGAIVGIGGVWAMFFVYQLKKYPLLPTSELYRLPEGHSHEHH